MMIPLFGAAMAWLLGCSVWRMRRSASRRERLILSIAGPTGAIIFFALALCLR